MRYTSASNRAMEGGVDSVGALVAGSFQAQSQSQRVALEALAIVAEGIERAVRVGRGLSLEDIDSQGLSVVDMFYAEVCTS